MELKAGTKVNLTNGASCTVVKELGRGGQGIVYLVDLSGMQMALKWYISAPDDAFYRNLQNNINNGAPSNAFIWPEYLSKKENGSYGYVMRLRPNNYYEFGNFLLAKKHFKSFQAMLAAAMKICNGFMMLHRHGLSYQDLNDGNFFIDPDTGDVLICDNDNVVPQGEKSGIMGKARYMAPEVVAGGTPDKYSDRFSLSVILFLLFFCNHPFEGARVVKCPCMTEKFEKKFYGSEAVFIYDSQRSDNRPVAGIHINVIRRWPVFPPILKETFAMEFSKDRLENPSKRLIEQEWQKIISKIRDTLIPCPICGEETFYNEGQQCMNCSRSIRISRYLSIGDRKVYLSKGSRLFVDKDNTPDGEVVSNPRDPSMLLVRNLSKEVWAVETATGKSKIVRPQDLMPVFNGIKINFNNLEKGEIIVTN